MVGTLSTSADHIVAGEAAVVSRALARAFAGLILLVLAATGFALWDGRRTAIREYQGRQARLGIVLAERALQAVDLVVGATADQIRAVGTETDDDLRNAMAGNDIHKELDQKLRSLPQLEALAVLDSHGRAVNTSLFWPSMGRDLSAGDVFHHYLDQPDSDPYISSPETGLLSGDQTFFLTRRIVGRDGHFVGIVSGTISLQYFSISSEPSTATVAP
jgi:hypothetical protein